MQRTDAVNIILKVFLPCRCQCEATDIRPLTETDKMKTLTITREQFQDLEDVYDEAMSDRNVLLLRSIKAELTEMVECAHTEALAEWLDRLDNDLSPEGKAAEAMQNDFYAANDEAARRFLVANSHTEALEINQCFDFNVQQVELAAEHQRAVLERLA